MTATQLLAASRGIECTGPHRCVYCGAPASAPFAVPSSFTARDTLRCPGSQFACAGCLLALEEVGEAVYCTGERYQFTKAFRRMCSWVVTSANAVAATKGHIDYLRGVCLNPPEPPFAISLAVSGQRHILYRGVVCQSRDAASATLEGERIDYRPAELAAMLALAGRVCAATGKPALVESPGPSLWFRVCERYADGERIAAEWSNVWQSPLARAPRRSRRGRTARGR